MINLDVYTLDNKYLIKFATVHVMDILPCINTHTTFSSGPYITDCCHEEYSLSAHPADLKAISSLFFLLISTVVHTRREQEKLCFYITQNH